MRISLRGRLALVAGRAASGASRLVGRGRGQVVGGRIMLALAPDLLDQLGRWRHLALVSATNGKSTTTRFLAEALGVAGEVAHNATGANMGAGIVTALASQPKAPFAALEVDEAHLPALAAALEPEVVLLMNLSPDQPGRGIDPTLLAQRWRGMIERASWTMTVIANADDPLVAWAARPLPPRAPPPRPCPPSPPPPPPPPSPPP
ncbi:MAG: Mur ligase family protein, partial [Micrococcales bacterium]|nr:Mur ligase family protein [Micrococcales bacterium]